MLDFTTFNLSKCNISCKKTFQNLGPNLSYLGIFGLELEKTTVLCYFTSAPQIFSHTRFPPKIKILKFGTKIALIVYFEQGFQKANIGFEISMSINQ